MDTLICAICLFLASFVGQYAHTSCSVLESYHAGDAQRKVELNLGSVMENTGEDWNQIIVSGNEDLIREQSDLSRMVMEQVHKKKNRVPVAPLLTRVNRGTDNLALYKHTWQSSMDTGGVSSRAVDGNRNPLWDHVYGGDRGSCTHTENSQNPWWAVDLGTSTHVTHVVLYNRQDCCSERLNNAIVGLTQERPDIHNPPTVHNVYMCGSVPAASAVNNVTCASVYPPARFVTVLLLGAYRVLTLCEVEVFGRPVCSGACPSGQYQSAACTSTSDRVCTVCSGACPSGQYQSAACTPTSDRVCTGRTLRFNLCSATQQSTWMSTEGVAHEAFLAIDGNVYSGSCTGGSNFPWWSVDIGQPRHVTAVHIYVDVNTNFAHRFDNFRIWLSNTRPTVGQPYDCSRITCTLCYQHRGSFPVGSNARLNCVESATNNRYVIVQSSLNNAAICLREIQVFGD